MYISTTHVNRPISTLHIFLPDPISNLFVLARPNTKVQPHRQPNNKQNQNNKE